jgi:hypothetical protein
VSFLFQIRHGLGSDERSLGNVAEYIGGQLLVTGAVVWFLGMYATLVGTRRRYKETWLLISTAIPIIVFFGFSSFSKVAGPNWPVFAYFSFAILVTKFCLVSRSLIRRSLWSLAILTSLAISAVVTLHAKFDLVPLESYSKEMAAADATNWFYGWRELAAELKKYPDKEFAVTPSHQLSAEIIYYTDGLPARTDRLARPSEFNLWPWSSSLQGKDGLYVWTEDDTPGPYGEYFSSTTRGNSLTVYRDGKAIRTYHIISGQKSLGAPAPRG